MQINDFAFSHSGRQFCLYGVQVNEPLVKYFGWPDSCYMWYEGANFTKPRFYLYGFDNTNGKIEPNGSFFDSINSWKSIIYSPSDSIIICSTFNSNLVRADSLIGAGLGRLGFYSAQTKQMILIMDYWIRGGLYYDNYRKRIFVFDSRTFNGTFYSGQIQVAYYLGNKLTELCNTDNPKKLIILDTVINLRNSTVTCKIPRDSNCFNHYMGWWLPNSIDELYQVKYSHSYHCGKLYLSNQSDTLYKTFYWKINGQKYPALARDTVLSWPASGTYSIMLYGSNRYGYTLRQNDSLGYAAKPKAGYSTQSQPGCQYVAYSFSTGSSADTSTNGTISQYWDFGDGSDTSLLTGLSNINYTIAHTYTQSGSYRVRLVVSNGFCADTFEAITQVHILPVPKPGFTVSTQPDWCGLPRLVQIQAQTTTDVVRYFYDMGNGDTLSSMQPNLSYSYTQAGTYRITQRIEGSTGCITTAAAEISIKPGLRGAAPTQMAYTTVMDAQSTLSVWHKQPEAADYVINGSYITTDTFYRHSGIRPYEQNYSYLVAGRDSCGNTSNAGPASQTILLKANNQNENEYALLSYTPYEYWPQGVSRYQIETKANGQWQPVATLSGNSTQYIDYNFADSLPADKTFGRCYRIQALAKGAGHSSQGNEACVAYAPAVFLPTAFSPNGDGINEHYRLVLLGMKEYFLSIYTRWGQEVYYEDYKSPSQGWDGTYKGEALPAGQYLYVFKGLSGIKSSQYHNPANNIEKQGTILLLR